MFKRFGLLVKALLALVLLGGALPAAAQTKVALVIGESAYRNVAQLPNPTRDAVAVAQSLKQVGFSSVTVKTDLDKSGLEAALQEFTGVARGADVALVYYAGHGVEVGGVNYLVPVNARLAADSDVRFETVSLDLVLETVSGAREIKMVVLDACRDNPFLVTMQRTSSSRSVGRGLARIEPDAGTLVAYAAREGSTAADGDGQHSPFARAFMENIQTPGLEIRLLFGKIRDDVYTATQQKQEPATYASLGGKPFYFVAGDPTGAAVDPNAGEKAFWNSIAGADDPKLFEAYLRTYPGGLFTADARQKVATLAQEAASRRGLQGSWNGEYGYNNSSQKPVQFAMMVTSSGSQIAGTMSEPNTFGDANAPFLTAKIVGTLNGRNVQFTKVYDGTGGQSHSVQYRGTLNPDTKVISGTWSINDTSGPFRLQLRD